MILRLAIVASVTVLAHSGPAWAQGTANEGLGAFLRLLTERAEATFVRLPEITAYFTGLAAVFDLRTTLLLVAVVVVGLFVEWAARQLLVRVRHRIHQKGAKSPMRSLAQVMLLDGLALLALWAAGRLIVAQIGEPASMQTRLGHLLLLALVYWRGFNFVFRAWLRPSSPGGRLAPVDDGQARRLLRALNVVIVLPVMVRTILQAMSITGAPAPVVAATAVILVPLVAAGLVWAVWHWRHDMAAWFEGMVAEKDLFRAGKLALAQNWWVGGLLFYAASGLLAVYAALTNEGLTNAGFAAIESMLLLLLLFETLLYRMTRHLPMEVPTVGEVVASCFRLAVRLWAALAIARAVMVGALGAMTLAEWMPHDQAAKVAALSALGFFVGWRILKYRMDRYIADNPLPTAGLPGDDDGPAAASRLRTIMPVLRVTIGVTLLVLGALLVLSQLGINVTPLIAGFSVLGLAVSFGSQSLVRDIVSGMFFLAEDSFRVGEYIDGTKVKGTVESFTVRSIRLRHQNGQLHIVPFGQLTHITNFSRDWTTVKFNLAFALDTDVELLRKTVKKIGMQMMEEAQFQKELLQPLKMQGLVDIKDAALFIRFKFTARPKNPSMIQRMAIRRMYEQLPALGIRFATPMFPMGMAPGAFAPPAAPVALPAPSPSTAAAPPKAAE
jgi:small-conductance mechanosensitive channel